MQRPKIHSFSPKELASLISTDLLEKETWLISTILLDLISLNPFSLYIISIYGFNPTTKQYLGESLKTICIKGPNDDNYLVRIPEEELKTQLKNGYWTKLHSKQVGKLLYLVSQAKQIISLQRAQIIAFENLATFIPEGFEWKLLNGATCLIPVGSIDKKEAIGFYEKVGDKWKVWLLEEREEGNFFFSEEINIEVDCKVSIILQLKSLDPEERVWKFIIPDFKEEDTDLDTEDTDPTLE